MTYKRLKMKKDKLVCFRVENCQIDNFENKEKKTAGKMKIQVINIDCNFSLKLRNFQCRLGRHQKCEQF